MKNVGLALEILSIYLAYLFEQNKLDEINKIKEIRKKIYNGDDNALEKVLKDYAETVKQNIIQNKKSTKQEIRNVDNDFYNMYINSEKYLLDNNKKNTTPTAIIIGGQQGSGKTGIVLKSVKEFNNRNKDVVILDLDAYRGFYKNCFELIASNPEAYAEITNKLVGKIMETLTNKIINNKFNFIFEGTLGNSAYTLDLLMNSKIKYNIIVKVLAVCREESLLSNFERYIETYKRIGLGRLTTIEKHDETYKNFTERFKNLEEKGILIEVYRRGEKINHPVMIYQTCKSDNVYINAYEALIEGRKENYHECMNTVKDRLKQINNNLTIFQRKEKTLNELKKLNYIFDYI